MKKRLVENKSKQVRTRNYATVVYPESAPNNWLEIVQQQLVPCFISPLHDKDINPTGEPKKPHYHVMYCFDSVKTPIQARELFECFGGVGCEVVNSMRGYARYLCHLDNPEKARYDALKVITYGCLDYHEICTIALDKYRAIKEMMAFCNDNKLFSFAKLSMYASEFQFDWFKILCDCGAVFMKEFLKSSFLDNQQEDLRYNKAVAKDKLRELKKDTFTEINCLDDLP